MKYCTICGKEVNDDAVICVSCGTSLKKTSGTSGSVDNTSMLAIIGLVLCFIFWPAGLGLSIYSFNNLKDNKECTEYKLSLAGIIIGAVIAISQIGFFFFPFF